MMLRTRQSLTRGFLLLPSLKPLGAVPVEPRLGCPHTITWSPLGGEEHGCFSQIKAGFIPHRTPF
jgi:hypothetical protein